MLDEFKYLNQAISTEIYKFLYEEEYNYRFRCLFCSDSHYLHLKPQWSYHLKNNLLAMRKGKDVSDIQNAWECTGYSCDLCRIELSYFEYVYHCDNQIGDEHDYCLLCIDTLITQYNQMKPFIVQILKNKLDNHCIDEIVTCCVGKVIQFKFDLNDNVFKQCSPSKRRRLC